MMSVRTFSFKKDITGTESLFSWGMSLRLLFWAWHSWVSFLPCGWRHWELSPLNVTSFVGFLLRGWLHCELSLKRWRHWELSPLRMTSLRAFFFEDVVTKSFLLWEWRHWEHSSLRMSSLRAFSFENDVTESLLLFHTLHNVEETVLLYLKYTVHSSVIITKFSKQKKKFK